MRIVAGWVALTFLIGAIQYVLWHWPVRKRMEIEDKLVRGGLLVVMVDITVVGAMALASVSRQVLLWTAIPALALAGTFIVVGFTVLLWKFRYHRDTAAITTSVGELGRPDRPSNGDY